MSYFKKSDLQPGQLVKLRDGKLAMVMPVAYYNFKQTELVLVFNASPYAHYLRHYNDDLLHMQSDESDIIQVYSYTRSASSTLCIDSDASKYRTILWQRPNKQVTVTVTLSEQDLFKVNKLLGTEIKPKEDLNE